jgi:hypothetical protein
LEQDYFFSTRLVHAKVRHGPLTHAGTAFQVLNAPHQLRGFGFGQGDLGTYAVHIGENLSCASLPPGNQTEGPEKSRKPECEETQESPAPAIHAVLHARNRALRARGLR